MIVLDVEIRTFAIAGRSLLTSINLGSPEALTVTSIL